MINKQNIFASSGQQTPGYSASDYTQGMVPNTIAMAEDVNSFGNTLDKDLNSVCKEVANVITNGVIDKDGGDGDALNDASFTQLLTSLRAMSNGFVQTGVMYNGVDAITIPTQDGVTSIEFGELKIMFNEGGYFGNAANKMHIGTIASGTTWTVTNSVPLGVVYLYAYMSGGAVTIQYSQNVLSGSEGASKCLLGSCFVINNNGTHQIQANSWKFQPWLQNTPAIVRETPTAETKGGLLTPDTGTDLNIGVLDIKAEGINFDSGSHQNPNVKTRAASAFSYKFLYPGYDPNEADETTLDTTHLYNLTTSAWDDVSSHAGEYIVMVPCIVPTGQTLLIPAMSYYDTNTGKYGSMFETIEDATASIYSLPYTSTATDKTRERAIYLGYSIVVKIGATDLTSTNNFVTVGMIPQALDGFSSAGGQTGGATGTYIPMQTFTWNADSLTLKPNYMNIITGRTAQIQVSFPTPITGVYNQIEIQYTHSSSFGGLNFIQTTGIAAYEWWDSTAPTFVSGETYLIHFEYVGGKWMGTVTRTNTDSTDAKISNLLNALYPVGGLYFGTQSTCPMSTLMPGTTWEIVGTNKAMWGGDGTNGATTIAAGLPEISGTFRADSSTTAGVAGAFKVTASDTEPNAGNWGVSLRTYQFKASDSNSIYGNSDTVQPAAYVINVWRRTA